MMTLMRTFIRRAAAIAVMLAALGLLAMNPFQQDSPNESKNFNPFLNEASFIN
jgi:hypothetical protein